MATPREEELLMLHLGSIASRPFNLNVSINCTLVPMELDTGAAGSINNVCEHTKEISSQY